MDFEEEIQARRAESLLKFKHALEAICQKYNGNFDQAEKEFVYGEDDEFSLCSVFASDATSASEDLTDYSDSEKEVESEVSGAEWPEEEGETERAGSEEAEEEPAAVDISKTGVITIRSPAGNGRVVRTNAVAAEISTHRDTLVHFSEFVRYVVRSAATGDKIDAGQARDLKRRFNNSLDPTRASGKTVQIGKDVFADADYCSSFVSATDNGRKKQYKMVYDL